MSSKKGESVIITVDSSMDFLSAEEIVKAAEVAGGKVVVAWHSTPNGYGKMADDRLPDSLKETIPSSNVWIELNNQRLIRHGHVRPCEK